MVSKACEFQNLQKEFQNLQKEFQNLQKFSLRAFFVVVFKKLCLSLQNNDNLKHYQ